MSHYVGDAPLEVIIGDGAGIDDNLGNDNENADGRDSARKGPVSGSGRGAGLSGIDGGDDTGLRKGSLGPATSRKGSNLGDDSRGPGKINEIMVRCSLMNFHSLNC